MKNNSKTTEIFKARTIGSFFILVFLAYGFGRYFFESTNTLEKYLGALLVITNSAMVFFIGILFRKTLNLYNSKVGNIYLFTRVFEALVLLSLFLEESASGDLGYFLAMTALGLGSIPMCWTLYKHKISPPWLAIWGVVGYAIFSFGFIMELFGKEWSMYLLGLAGLWELTFGIWLIVKGSKTEQQKTNGNDI